MLSNKVKPSESSDKDIQEKSNQSNQRRKNRTRILKEKLLKEKLLKDKERISRIKGFNKIDIWIRNNLLSKINPHKGKLGKRIKVLMDGIGFESLNAALRSAEPELWKDESDYRRSCWTRINRNLKKKGIFKELNHTFILI